MSAVTALLAEPLDIELSEPFGIATGAQLTANNVLVRVVLDDQTVGFGEAAPFPAVSGETQTQTLATLQNAAPLVVGQDARRWRRLAHELAEFAPNAPAARAAIEMALLDALARRAKLSLWHWFGGAIPELTTDITITTGTVEQARAAAERACLQDFAMLKVKIGGVPIETDVERLRAIAEAAPEARLLLDANASLTAEQALELLAALGQIQHRVALFEQPTSPDDLEGLRRIRERSSIPVAADESARHARDVVELAAARAADVVNVKITKSGIAEALDMIAVAQANGLGLMIGGMVESALAMSVSACLAAGVGGFSFIDLDTPLFLVRSPLRGGSHQAGPHIRVDQIAAGHGVEPAITLKTFNRLALARGLSQDKEPE